ncbi:hypothetical protein [Agromyces aerolatus]|uniref:hypothetical protein n=1 Tax=Agromyces sp. LY-1074 TaxID=3074080 RepID=UPI00285AA7CE|nr:MULTISPECIES: hypothetical protein [unclassified Agromyces]MDR5699883.1 hypothetical protein [Agromyces sp. LY-1074]MDR5706305.1 hypothetical protein [Agromyces sp. LY-1358]
MDYVFAGLPLHVLLVHAVLVLVPLLVLLLVVVGAWPAARRVLWLPCLVLAALLLPLVLVTVEAGKWLQQRVPPAPLIEVHTGRGETLVPCAIGLLAVAVVVAGWAIVELLGRRRPNGQPVRAAVIGMSALLTLGALGVGAGATWTLILIGESGSRAVWEGSFSEDPLE